MTGQAAGPAGVGGQSGAGTREGRVGPTPPPVGLQSNRMPHAVVLELRPAVKANKEKAIEIP